MKTVIEMAREVGAMEFMYSFAPRSFDFNLDALERFAALVREDDAERIAALEQDNANCRKAISDLMDELQNHSEQDLNMVQEPVAWECHCQGKTVRAVKVEAHRAANKRDYENWKWAAEQSAAYSARQMRDAAVKVCRENAEAWGRLNADDEKHGAERCANEIAALPVPEVQWREITDDDVLEVMRDISPATHPQLFARAVIAKFKEKQL